VSVGRRGHGRVEDRVLVERAILDREVDAGQILVDDPAGADVEVTDLRVALLALRQADGLTRRMQDRVRPARPQRVPVGLRAAAMALPDGSVR
jgi:hypothetical protein